MTGGGSAMLYERLGTVLDHNRILLADEAATIHLANVRGGLKLWHMYEAEDLL